MTCFVPVFPSKHCKNSLFPYVLRAQLISFVLILSPEQYLVRRADYEAPHCAVFSSVLSFPPWWTQTPPSAPHSPNTVTLCSSPELTNALRVELRSVQVLKDVHRTTAVGTRQIGAPYTWRRQSSVSLIPRRRH